MYEDLMLVDNYIPSEGAEYDGGIIDMVANRGFNPFWRRPYIDSKGRPSVSVPTGKFINEKGELVANAKVPGARPQMRKQLIGQLMMNGFIDPVWNSATLRRDEWIAFDNAIITEVRTNLRAWSDLAAASTYRLDGMANTLLESETVNDTGKAYVDIDGLTQGNTDDAIFQPVAIPIPITHSDFWISKRRLNESRKKGAPLDTIRGEQAARRVAEMIEDTVIGIETGMAYGAGTQYATAPQIYGMANHPDRETYATLTPPTAVGWTCETTYNEVLAMVDQQVRLGYSGPFVLYYSSDWGQYMDRVFSAAGGNHPGETLRTMLLKISKVSDVRVLDRATPSALNSTFNLWLIQMTPDVAQAIIGMDINTIQWESVGGLRLNFKVMCMYVPRFRSTQSGKMGLLHATPAP